MSAQALAVGVLGLLLGGCTSSVFNQPMTLSTKTVASAVQEELGQVSVHSCDTMIVLFPVPGDSTATMLDDLLEEAKQMGGDAVVDVQVRAAGGSSVMPLYLHDCVEMIGTAVVLTKPKRTAVIVPSVAPDS